MGRKALEVGDVSKAAAIIFERIREKRGLNKKDVYLGVGIPSSSRYQALIKGTSVWTLDDVELFATFHKIPLKSAFILIEKELHSIISEKSRLYLGTAGNFAS